MKSNRKKPALEYKDEKAASNTSIPIKRTLFSEFQAPFRSNKAWQPINADASCFINVGKKEVSLVREIWPSIQLCDLANEQNFFSQTTLPDFQHAFVIGENSFVTLNVFAKTLTHYHLTRDPEKMTLEVIDSELPRISTTVGSALDIFCFASSNPDKFILIESLSKDGSPQLKLSLVVSNKMKVETFFQTAFFPKKAMITQIDPISNNKFYAVVCLQNPSGLFKKQPRRYGKTLFVEFAIDFENQKVVTQKPIVIDRRISMLKPTPIKDCFLALIDDSENKMLHVAIVKEGKLVLTKEIGNTNGTIKQLDVPAFITPMGQVIYSEPDGAQSRLVSYDLITGQRNIYRTIDNESDLILGDGTWIGVIAKKDETLCLELQDVVFKDFLHDTEYATIVSRDPAESKRFETVADTLSSLSIPLVTTISMYSYNPRLTSHFIPDIKLLDQTREGKITARIISRIDELNDQDDVNSKLIRHFLEKFLETIRIHPTLSYRACFLLLKQEQQELVDKVYTVGLSQDAQSDLQRIAKFIDSVLSSDRIQTESPLEFEEVRLQARRKGCIFQ